MLLPKRFIIVVFMFLLTSVTFAEQSFDDQGNPNNPRINERANACYEGASMQDRCRINFDWELGWYLIRIEFGMLTYDDIPSQFRPTIPPTTVPPTTIPPTTVPPTTVPPTTVPPTTVPPTTVPPTAVPPTVVPPTAVPPTAIPPTTVPPTAVPPTTVPPTVVPPTTIPPTAIPPSTCAFAWTPSYYVDFSNSNIVSSGNYWSDPYCTIYNGNLGRYWVYAPSGITEANSICVANFGSSYEAIASHGPLVFECV